MKPQDFENLLIEAELHPWSAAKAYGVAFSVALRIPTAWGVRHQCEWLVYQPAEFAMMSTEQAKGKIAVIKAKLERAAKTKTGGD